MKGTLIHIAENYFWCVWWYEDNEIKYEMIDKEDWFQEGMEIEFRMVEVKKLYTTIKQAQICQ